MKFALTTQEIKLMQNEGIQFEADREYSDFEALDLVELVRDVEISYSQFTTVSGKRMYQEYGNLADKMQCQIPEN